MKFIFPKQYKIKGINIIYLDWFEITKYLMLFDGIIASVGVWGLLMFDKGKKLGIAVTLISFLLHLIIVYVVDLIRKEHKL